MYNYKIKIVLALAILTQLLFFANIQLLHLKTKLLQQEINLIIQLEEQKKIQQEVLPFIPEVQEEIKPVIQISQGKASWYDYTLSGIQWSKNHRTAASRDYPRGTMLKVCNIANNKCIDVLVNDYGPEKAKHPDRIVDLSSYAFSQIADIKAGIINVSVHEIKT